MSDAAMFPASDKGRARLKHFTRLKWTAFVLTFFAYTSFHLSRKPASIVKNVLHPSSPDGQSTYNASTNPGTTTPRCVGRVWTRARERATRLTRPRTLPVRDRVGAVQPGPRPQW